MTSSRRILVYGVTGSGKSTLAARIAERLELPCHAMDDLTWEAGWVSVPADEQRRRVAEVVAGDAWVIDASYGTWSDLVLARVELIVGLDLPPVSSFGRLLRRTVSRIARRTPTCNGNTETWRGAFLDRDSILVWHVTSFRRKRARMREWQAGADFPETVLLHSPGSAGRTAARGCPSWTTQSRPDAISGRPWASRGVDDGSDGERGHTFRSSPEPRPSGSGRTT